MSLADQFDSTPTSSSGGQPVANTGPNNQLPGDASGYNQIIEAAGRRYNVDPRLLGAMIQTESTGRPGAVSNKGAVGLMQIMPSNYKALGITDPTNPEQNIMGGAQLMSTLLDKYGDVPTALLHYTGGDDQSKWGVNTHAYPAKVLANYQHLAPQTGASAPATTAASAPGAAQPTSLADQFDSLPSVPTQGHAAPAGPQPGMLASMAAGAGHGLGSMAMGAQELVGRGLDAAGAHTIGPWLANDAQQGQRKLDAEVAPYQQAHGVATGAGDIVGGIGGMAMAPEVKALQGTGFLANAAKGAAYGVTAHASNPDADFLSQKGLDAVAGGLFGGIGAKVAQFATPYLSSAVNAIRGRLNPVMSSANASTAAAGIVNDVLQRAGVDSSKVSPDAMAAPVSQIADALKSGGAPSPNAAATIARIGEAASLPVPVELSAGQAGRDPMQFARERNWRGVSGVGETVQALEARQNAQLAGNLDALGANKAPAPIDVGRQIIGAANSFDNNWSNHISRLYDAVKNTGGTSAAVNTVEAMKPVAQNLRDSFISADSLPGDVQRIYQGMRNGTLPLTAGEMMSVDKMLSRAQQGASDGNVRYAIGQIRNGLSNAQVDGSAGQDAVAAYNHAKAAAKQRFDYIDANPWYGDAINGVQPDNFFKRNVLQADAQPLTNMMQGLQKANPDLAQSVQNATAAFLKSKAAPRATADEIPAFNHATFDRFVTDPNNAQRLHAVFGPQGFDTIQSINNVARNIKTAPPGANVNHSGTAGALVDMAQNGAQGVALSSLTALGRAARLGPLVDLGLAAARGIGNVMNRQKMAASVVTPQVATPASNQASGLGRRLFPAAGVRLSDLVGIPANAKRDDEQPSR
ncbi:transglycosylase SLT domain-containing protein [Burkholderia sp. AU30280]|uniref:transglycosylase SLT domain-containing protein n=1 Tax=Burkholderia sp. AU30280 TaxID=2879628 RepID=UPI001CF37697|nr:transglycosylase SLT domain-containing protein [Burkholderia sp. AU30280]MCA8275241.1 transglycosylase SLT domain-containing protein [Burkholderia sp. AU30280]